MKALSTVDNLPADWASAAWQTADLTGCEVKCLFDSDDCDECQQLAANPVHIDVTERSQWKDSDDADAKVWNKVVDVTNCITLESMIGVGIDTVDDQLLADLWGLQRLIDPATQAGRAIETMQIAVCNQDSADTVGEGFQSFVDLVIGAVVGYVAAVVCGLCAAPLAQLFIQANDDAWQDDFTHSVLQKDEYAWEDTGDEATFVENFMGPIWDTAKAGENDGGAWRGNPKNLNTMTCLPTVCPTWAVT